MKNFSNFTASLHTHVRSLYDAYINAEQLCEKIVKMGGKGCAITDHGVLSSIEDYKTVFRDNGLKLIPGCELYVDGGILGRLHLVVLAKNDNGYKGICRMVTNSNSNKPASFPVISQDELLKIATEYRGDIFALSACMQGVIAAIFLQNKTVEEKITSLKSRQFGYKSPGSVEVINADESVRKASEETDALILKRDNTKRIAEMKFAKREKAIGKELASGKDMTKELEELEADKKASATAIKELPNVKAELDASKKKLSAARKKQKEVNEEVDKYLSIEDEITSLKKELKTDDELYTIAVNTAKLYDTAFGHENFIAEVQFHGIPEEARCFPKVVAVAKDLSLPLVATNDVHILDNSEDDRLRRQILRSLRFAQSQSAKWQEENIGDSELYLKDNEELYKALTKIISEDDAERAIKNIDVVFNACNVEFKTGKHYPKYKEESR